MKNQLHLLYGNEPFLIQEKKTELLKSLGEASVSVYDMRETGIQAAVDEARTLDLFAERKILVLKDCYFLTGEQAKSKVEHDLDSLLAYLQKQNPSTSILFLVNHEKLDKRKKVVKELVKASATYEAKPLHHVQSWLQERAKLEGKRLTPLAATFMQQQLGTDLFLLDNELKKLSTAYPDLDELDVPHLEEVLSRSLENDVFKLIDRIANRQPSSLEIIHDLYQLGEDPIKILLLIARQFRIMHQIKAVAMQGKRPRDVVKMNPYVLSIAQEQAEMYSIEEIQERLAECAELDVAMKRGQVEKGITLETTILKWL